MHPSFGKMYLYMMIMVTTIVNIITIIIITILILLLQSALQPLWVLACSTIVEYSQQEGFYRVPLPVACQTPNLEDQ